MCLMQVLGENGNSETQVGCRPWGGKGKFGNAGLMQALGGEGENLETQV